MHRRQFLQVSVGAVLMGAGLGFKRSGHPDYTTGDDFVLDMSHYKTENMSPAYLRACRQLKVPEKDIGNVRIFEVRTQNFEEGRIPEITFGREMSSVSSVPTVTRSKKTATTSTTRRSYTGRLWKTLSLQRAPARRW